MTFESVLNESRRAGVPVAVEAGGGADRDARHAAGQARKQPTEEERKAVLDWIAGMKFLSPKDPGPFVIRRLNKVEYGNTLHDLFGVDPAVARELPDEVFGEGYLNTLSPLQSEQYLGIANEVLDRILAPPGAPPTAVQKRLFGEPPATPGADLRGGGEKGRPLAGPERLSPAAVGGGSGCAAAGLRSGDAKTEARLPGGAAPDAQGGPRFAAVPLHHARREARPRRAVGGHCSAG